MTTATLTSKGQTTIPKEIRDYLGIKPRERLSFEISNDTVVMRRASRSVAELAGSLKSSVKSANKIREREAIKRHLGQRSRSQA